MRKLMLSLAALGVLALGGCGTHANNCTGNGYVNKEYCEKILHPNAGPYTWHHADEK